MLGILHGRTIRSARSVCSIISMAPRLARHTRLCSYIQHGYKQEQQQCSSPNSIMPSIPSLTRPMPSQKIPPPTFPNRTPSTLVDVHRTRPARYTYLDRLASYQRHTSEHVSRLVMSSAIRATLGPCCVTRDAGTGSLGTGGGGTGSFVPRREVCMHAWNVM